MNAGHQCPMKNGRLYPKKWGGRPPLAKTIPRRRVTVMKMKKERTFAEKIKEACGVFRGTHKAVKIVPIRRAKKSTGRTKGKKQTDGPQNGELFPGGVQWEAPVGPQGGVE